MVEPPETKFTRLGGDSIAYQVLGEGPIDLLYMSGIGDCIDVRWDHPIFARFLQRLASFTRLIMFDRRGAGASDPVSLNVLPRWEEWADDALAVLDAVGSEQAAVFGISDASLAAILFAATRPERTRALIVANGMARNTASDDYPWTDSADDAERTLTAVADLWGTEEMVRTWLPNHANDAAFVKWNAKNMRMSCSRREVVAYMRHNNRVDVRDVLPTIRVPALVLHRKDTPLITIENGRYLADHLPQSRFVVIPGSDVTMYTTPNTATVDAIEEFLVGSMPQDNTERTLAAVLFTDIVDSTARAAALGDRRWRDVIESHDRSVREVVTAHRGRLVKLTGDGALATFDGPGRAIRCAQALQDALDAIGIDIRAGLHTGEIELRDEDISGIGVHVAARVLSAAGPRELLTSAAVPLLVAGSGIEFEDRGEHDLKGLEGRWRLFAVEA